MKTLIALLCAILITTTSYAETFTGKYKSTIISQKKFEQETSQNHIYNCGMNCRDVVLVITLTDGIRNKVVWTRDDARIEADEWNNGVEKWVTFKATFTTDGQITELLTIDHHDQKKITQEEIDWNHVREVSQKSLDYYKNR